MTGPTPAEPATPGPAAQDRAAADSDDVRPPRWRWALYALGTPIVAWGGYGLVTELGRGAVIRYGRFALGGVVVHDLLLAPLVVLAGVLFARLVPGRVRDLVQGGLVVSGAVTVLAVPFVLGYGRRTDDPSALPLDYGRGLLVTLAAVWAVVLVMAAGREVRRLRTSKT